jgi:hypothetical protein
MSALGQARAIVALGSNVKQGLNRSRLNAKAFRMSEPPRNKVTPAPSRAERLAAQLRENLRRRKAQSRAMAQAPSGGASESPAESLSKQTRES